MFGLDLTALRGTQCDFNCTDCDTSCPRNCNGTCDDSSETCNACNDGYHGSYCNLTCPGKCADSRCYTNGSCLSCESGYYGNSCNMECQQMCEGGRNQQTEETNSGSVIGGAVGAEYEIHDSEPRSELAIEGEDNRVYYNDERAYYKNVGGNVHKT
ncbi:hypothetical protein MAR_030632 [Mya arenaria]|uniref:Uncharacterized protein n=1 Tax=Mya arenaria TaxID=6604 RepID=A0ABY7F1H4_MYAAR|nr:hypothetical protein MAR_030632 [Mya arenaria]